MTAVEDQIAYFMKFMTDRQERRLWKAEFLRRAQALEKDWPVVYAGLHAALVEALEQQRLAMTSRTAQPERTTIGSASSRPVSTRTSGST